MGLDVNLMCPPSFYNVTLTGASVMGKKTLRKLNGNLSSKTLTSTMCFTNGYHLHISQKLQVIFCAFFEQLLTTSTEWFG